jgi:PilZ domain-containing protein
VSKRDRRKDVRMGMNLPVRVQGHNPDNEQWEEMTTSDDASHGGTSFNLPVRHTLVPGQVLLLSLPLPKNFRQYAMAEPSYRAYALVRHVAKSGNVARVGVMFLGQKPPKGYELNPGGRFLLPEDPRPPAPGQKERRKHERREVFLNLRLKRTDPSTGQVQEETTVTDNVSPGGARVRTGMAVSKGEVLMVEEVSGPFRTRAEIRNLFIGKDGIPRLNLSFLDGILPDRILA